MGVCVCVCEYTRVLANKRLPDSSHAKRLLLMKKMLLQRSFHEIQGSFHKIQGSFARDRGLFLCDVGLFS